MGEIRLYEIRNGSTNFLPHNYIIECRQSSKGVCRFSRNDRVRRGEVLGFPECGLGKRQLLQDGSVASV